MKSKILVASTRRWFSTVRLAIAFAEAGCDVEAVCPSGHPLHKARAVMQTHRFSDLAPVSSFADAIASAKPEIIIPTDDPAAHILHRLYRRESRDGETGAKTCALIERSIGSSHGFSVVEARTPFMNLAEEAGVRVPKTRAISDADELAEWTSETGFPTVLKADGSSGATGVRIVRTLQEARRAFGELQAAPPVRRTLSDTLAGRDAPSLWRAILRQRSVVNAQAFISGRDAISEIACWNGRVLASVQFEVLNKQYPSGPASVLRVIDNMEMAAGVEKIAQRLNLSGLHGFDFILEADTGNALLLEMNPRATQVGHLTLGLGHDLPAALHAALSEKPVRPAPRITENSTIALFPQEWITNPKSEYLRTAYHDVPWEHPELIRACVRSVQEQREYSERYAESAEQLFRASPSNLAALRAGKLPGAD